MPKTTINVYLTFDGNCEEAFNFYQSVFGGELAFSGRFADMPQEEGMPPIPEEDKNRIMHATLPISEETSLFGSDTMSGWGDPFVQGNNFSVSIDTDSKEEADRLMAALSADGQVTMPMNDTFWGSYFGMLKDQFGISWMISFW